MRISNEQKIKLGLFVILTIVVLITSLYLIGRKQNLFGNTFSITAIFSNVNGLKLGNNVRYSGINVGTVKAISMVNDSTICVDMHMEASILKHMRNNAKAVVGSDGLVGSMVVNIIPGDSFGAPLKRGDTIMSLKRISSNDMLSTLSVTNENAAELTNELLKITHSINEGEGTLGLLVNDKDMGTDLKETVHNLRIASEEVSEVLKEIKGLFISINNEDNLLNTLVKDSVTAVQFKTVMSNLEKSSKDINTAILNLNEFSERVVAGEGAVNYILTDTVLVKDIGETVDNIKKGSEMLNENLEALRHNTFFKGYFKKLEKERLKEEKKAQKDKESN